MADRNYGRLTLSGLRVAACAWIAVALWEWVRLRGLRDMGLVAEAVPRDVALVLSPLAAAWALVLWWSGSTTNLRVLGSVMAQALSVGAFASVLLMVATYIIFGPRTGAPIATIDFVAGSLGAQLVAFFMARRIVRILRPQATVSGRTVIGLAAGAVLVSFALNAMTGLGGPRVCQATEAAAVSDLRSIIAAEDAYQGVNAGRFGTLECLVEPQRCLPDFPPDGSNFLGRSFLTPIRCGYRFTFHPGRDSRPSSESPSVDVDVDAYAVTAVPVAPGRSGERGFCADSTGTLRVAPDGRLPTPSGGRCPDSLEFLP